MARRLSERRLLKSVSSQLFRVSEYLARSSEIAGHPVIIVSYKIGERFACKIDNASVGLNIATVYADTKEAANFEACAKAEQLLMASTRDEIVVQQEVERPAVSKILLKIGEEEVSVRPRELFELADCDRMSLILKGRLSFYDAKSKPISAGRAIEILAASCPAQDAAKG